MAGAAPAGGSTFGVPNNSSLAQPGQVLSGQALIDAAKQLANAQTQGPLTELARQIAQNNTQTQNAQALTSKYFNELGGFMQQGVQDQQMIGAGLNHQLGDISNQENLRLAGIQADATANMNKYAPGGSTGLNGAAMSSLATEMARQQGLAAQNEGAFRSAGALQGANQAGLMANQMGAYSTRGQEMIGDIGRAGQLKNEPLTSKMAALKAQEGALFSTDLGKLRQQEIVNQDTAKTLGIKQQQVNATIANDKARLNLGYAQIRAANWRNTQTIVGANGRNQANIDAANARNAADNAVKQMIANQKAGPGGIKPLSTADNNKVFGLFSRFVNLIPYYKKQGVVTGKDANGNPIISHDPKVIRTTLDNLAGMGGDTLTTAAWEALGYGYLTQSTATALQQLGLNLSSWRFRGQPIRIVPDSAANGNYTISPGGKNSPH